MGQNVGYTKLDRYEMKFLIPAKMVSSIVHYISSYCDLDPHSLNVAGHYYRVNSIYIDTPDNLFYESRKAGVSDRMNMRFRFYGAMYPDNIFFEIKQRKDGIVHKTRDLLPDINIERLLSLHDGIEKLDPDSDLAKNLKLAASYEVKPKIMTIYERLAYCSVIDRYVRVTFDRNLLYKSQNTFDFEYDNDDMKRYKGIGNSLSESTIIMEIKWERQMPKWIMDIIRELNLEQVAFSKYFYSYSRCLGMDKC